MAHICLFVGWLVLFFFSICLKILCICLSSEFILFSIFICFFSWFFRLHLLFLLLRRTCVVRSDKVQNLFRILIIQRWWHQHTHTVHFIFEKSTAQQSKYIHSSSFYFFKLFAICVLVEKKAKNKKLSGKPIKSNEHEIRMM